MRWMQVDELNELTEQVKILQKRITTLLEERAELEDRMRKQPEPVEESAEFKEAAEEIQAASSIGEGGGAPPVIAPTKPTETNRVTGDTETGVIPTTGPVAA